MAAPSTDAAAPPVVLGGARAWLVWAIAVLFVIYYFSFQTGYSIVNSVVQKDVGLDIAQVGIIAAGYTWMFALCQFLSGPLLDRVGARTVLLPAIVLVTIGIFLFANARNFPMLMASQIVIAIGACTGFVGAGYVGGSWFGWAKFSLMFGLVQFSASLFSAFNQNALSWALDLLSWRELFNYVGMAGIVLLVVAVLWLRDPAPVAAPSGHGFGAFFHGVGRALMQVARVPHVWVATAYGALCFGTMLALGVVWGPKLLMLRGLSPGEANLGASLLWLGLAAGCFTAPWASDRLRRRKPPILAGLVLQVAALALLLYGPSLGVAVDFALCFAFGLGNSAHMLAFSTAADVVEPQNIGTSAALVNGFMFIMGGVLISRPGMRVGLGLESGVAPGTMDMAQFAARPLMLSIVVALVIAAFMRETYPAAPENAG